MKQKIVLLCLWLSVIVTLFVGCQTKNKKAATLTTRITAEGETQNEVTTTDEITELEEGLLAVSYSGDDGFDDFLAQGGASTDKQVVNYLVHNVIPEAVGLEGLTGLFGCSTLSSINPQGEVLFGRNFDWEHGEALIVGLHPDNGYHSISTVNMDFIKSSAGGLLNRIPDKVKTLAAIYAPLDGMNEKGLAVSVNMIQDSAKIEQNTEKADITTTTAIRLLLNKAATVEEALELLSQYDLHGSMGMMIHFAIADATGRSVVVEYINHEMIVTETPVVTNFYLAEGEKYGVGSQQSQERYDILIKLLEENETLTMEQVRDGLNRVSKDNFNEFESTEWSIVFNQSTGEVRYYHRENYEKSYIFQLEVSDDSK